MSNRYVGGVITEKVNVAQAPWSGEWTEQTQLQAKAQGTWAPYSAQVTNSLRFRSSASAYLNRTPASAGNRKTWTWSGWVKRGALGANSYPFACAYAASDSGFLGIYFNSDDTLAVSGYNTYWRKTTQVFRDPSAWYHIVVAFDTTQATGANRVKMYLNGIQITAFGTSNDPTLNTDYPVNNNQAHFHSCYSLGTPTNFFDGYLAEVNFIDGQALTPSYFGQFSPTTGVWGPTVYGGTYGTNGFHLSFSNGTSTTTLGYDSSGNSNNWTTNNISLTAGSTYDWMLDSPTPLVGTSYGVGNYAVLNPLARSAATFSDANMTAAVPAVNESAISSMSMASGKWYAEFRLASTANFSTLGVCNKNYIPFANSPGNDSGGNSTGYISTTGQVRTAIVTTSYGNAYTTNDIIGIAVDIDNNKLFFSKNGVWQNSGDPVAGTNPATSISLTGGQIFFVVGTSDTSGSSTWNANFGQRPFAYTPPTGFKSLCTYNLPTATILNGAQYMAATTYTGSGTTQSIANTTNGVYFKPDMVWVKARSAAQSNSLQDSVRGITLQLSSNLTTAEITSSGEVTALNSNGFSLGADVTGYGTNGAATTYVGWQWKASNATAVTNTSGTITSQVSASALSGFSVVTWTGNATGGATIGHGLGVAPSFVISKRRDVADDWSCYHVSLGGTKYIDLNSTAAAGTSIVVWNNTSPSSTVITLGTSNRVNALGGTYVAYCFAAIAGYSAFGSYTGNGSADGPFVYCGFRPRWILLKIAVGGTANWLVQDSARDTYNPEVYLLNPNLSSAEANNSGYAVDFVANGFKLRNATTAWNYSGATFIYAAFAENPFTVALAR